MTGVVCAFAALYLHQSAGAAKRLEEANELGRAGRYAAAAQTAREVRTPPADAQALLTLATALERQGLLRQASTVLATAARRDPNNYYVHLRWATVLDDQGRRALATREISRALGLNPRLQVPQPFTVVGAGPLPPPAPPP